MESEKCSFEFNGLVKGTYKVYMMAHISDNFDYLCKDHIEVIDISIN
jgi:hypothetical protein